MASEAEQRMREKEAVKTKPVEPAGYKFGNGGTPAYEAINQVFGMLNVAGERISGEFVIVELRGLATAFVDLRTGFVFPFQSVTWAEPKA